MFNFVIFAVSLVLSVFLAEGVTRLVLDPMDYLAVSTTSDPVLNHRIPAGGSGHDDWGFRNSEVPDKADILAVGDSMTYGVMAKSFESWPAQLEDRTDQRVYNAALGGYGPLHYLHILKARAPDLQPEKAIVMLYAGNDLMDAYNLAYSNDAWAAYRRADNTETLDSSLFLPQEKKTRLTKRIRNWLAHHSVLYRLVTQSPLFDATRQREHLEASTSFGFTHLGAPVVLDPGKRLSITDVADPRIREGLQITKRALAEIAAYSAENGIDLHVALMPVRELVFHDLVGDLKAEDAERMDQLRQNLEIIEADLGAYLDGAGISWTNLRPVMETALATRNIYPPTDGHPNAIGYGIVAEAIARDSGF